MCILILSGRAHPAKVSSRLVQMCGEPIGRVHMAAVDCQRERQLSGLGSDELLLVSPRVVAAMSASRSLLGVAPRQEGLPRRDAV